MKVFTKEAEKTLFEQVPVVLIEAPLQRLLYIRISQAGIEQENWQETLTEATREVFGAEDTDLYICFDRDIFVMNRAINYKRLDSFMTHLTQKLSPASLSKELASLFEVGVHSLRIKEICLKKIEAKRIEDEIAARQKAAKASNTLPNVTTENFTNEELVKTLSKRRKERKTLEVLAVEDDMFSQKLIKNALAQHYSLTLTGDGRGAMLHYLHKAPDILFLDIGLPDIDGHTVLKKIFEVDPEAYVVMFSGQGDRENVMKAIDHGARGFVGKPFTQEKLIQYIVKSPFVIEKMQGVPHGYYNR